MISYTKKALRFIKSSASKIAGLFVGASSGYLSGIVAAKYDLFDIYPNSSTGILKYACALPFYIVGLSLEGAAFGWRYGLTDAFNFLKIVNFSIENKINDNALYSKLKEYNSHQFSFLSEEEIVQLEKKLDKPNLSEFEKNLHEGLRRYIFDTSALSKQITNQMKNPIGVKIGTNIYIEDANHLESLVKESIETQKPNYLPFKFNNQKVTVKSLIDYKNLFPNLITFVHTARDFLTRQTSSQCKIYCSIGKPQLFKSNDQENKAEKIVASSAKDNAKSVPYVQVSSDSPIEILPSLPLPRPFI